MSADLTDEPQALLIYISHADLFAFLDRLPEMCGAGQQESIAGRLWKGLSSHVHGTFPHSSTLSAFGLKHGPPLISEGINRVQSRAEGRPHHQHPSDQALRQPAGAEPHQGHWTFLQGPGNLWLTSPKMLLLKQ